MTGEIAAVGKIAANEFKRHLGHPVTIAVFCLLVALAVANGLGSIRALPSFESWLEGDVFIKVGLSQEFFNISQYCSTAALILGVLTIAEDRRRTTGILLTKPVRKRDVVAGKFLGLNAFLLLLITVTYLLVSLLIALAFRGPLSTGELALRLAALILTLALECGFLAGVGMLIGIVFGSLKEAIIVGVTYLCIEWFSNGMFMNVLKVFSPYYVYFKIVNNDDTVTLFNTVYPFVSWLNPVIPYVALMAAGVIVVLAINCVVVTMSEDY